MANNYVIRVASGKDGMGKSAVAMNFAVALASLGKKVVLIDADLYNPFIAQQLGIENIGTSFRDVFYYKMDVKEAIIRYEKGGFDVMVTRKGEAAFVPTPDQLRTLAGQVSNVSYDYIIIDTSTSFFTPQLALYYNESLVVATPDESAIESTLKLIKLYEEVNIKYTLVLNMVTGADYELKKEEIEKILNHKVAAVLPDDDSVPRSRSVKQRMPACIFDKSTAFCKAMTEFASQYP